MFRVRSVLFLMLFSFSLGAIAMLFVLTPGQFRWDDLLDGEKRQSLADFDTAARRVEEFPRLVSNLTRQWCDTYQERAAKVN